MYMAKCVLSTAQLQESTGSNLFILCNLNECRTGTHHYIDSTGLAVVSSVTKEGIFKSTKINENELWNKVIAAMFRKSSVEYCLQMCTQIQLRLQDLHLNLPKVWGCLNPDFHMGHSLKQMIFHCG